MKNLFIILLFCVARYSEQCECEDDFRYIRGEPISENLCKAETIIEVRVTNVKDGLDGTLEYKVQVLNIPRGNLNGIQNEDVVYMPLPDPMCHSEIVLMIGHEYVLSVDKVKNFMVLNLCNFAEDAKELSEIEKHVLKHGCP